MAGKRETALKNLSKAKNKGRPKGSKNKTTAQIVEIITTAHTNLVKAKKDLSVMAKEDPKWFYQHIWARLIPRDIKLDIPEDFKIIVTKDE